MVPNHAAQSLERGNKLAKRNKSQLSVQVLKKFRIIFGSVRQHFREVEKTCGVTGSQLWILQEVAVFIAVGGKDQIGHDVNSSHCG